MTVCEATRGPCHGRCSARGRATRHALGALDRDLQSTRIPERLGALEAAGAALSAALSRTEPRVQELFNRLYAAPYLSAPELLHFTDGNGERVIGYVATTPLDDAGYREFEDMFRGDEAFIRDRLHRYLPLLAGHQPVLEIGSGRGELLELLREAGIAATGVDADESMVRRCREKQLTVTHGDALAYLTDLRDASLGAVFAAHVIEHLEYDKLIELLQSVRSRLRSGGRLILETPNPHCLEAFKTFSTDPTHRSPIFPEVLVALCRLHGFREARIVFPFGSGPYDQDCRTCGEYALVAAP